jgi:hypothetical protein
MKGAAVRRPFFVGSISSLLSVSSRTTVGDPNYVTIKDSIKLKLVVCEDTDYGKRLE